MSSDPTTLRVALRYALAARRTVTASMRDYFEVGDPVLWGRWKNKHAKIVAFSADAKGNPLVEIEPIPKGRKSNKTFSLFKLWHDPPPALRGDAPPAAGGAVVAADPDDDDDEDDDHE